MTDRHIRIGGASGFWGDSDEGAIQLLTRDKVDYLVFDYLSEVTMSLLARARRQNPNLGYARDFVDPTMASILPFIAEQGVKVVANCGGVNLGACKAALEKLAETLNVQVSVAIVLGDDLMNREVQIRAAGVTAFDDGGPLPENLVSMNAYLGAFPIAAALASGADIVVTGRCADSALVLGPLIHEFGWSATDHDLLAAGSLAGHIIECGVQAVGGNFTDWEAVEGWDDMGYPVVECKGNGEFVITKPAGTGGLVTEATVAEQLVYELGDPTNYILPDVVCDFSSISLTQDGPDRVKVSGAKGRPSTPTYKVSATYQDGYRSTAMFTMVGRDNYRKITRVGESILARTRRLFAQSGLMDYRRTSLKIIGAEDVYGSHAAAHARSSRELVLRLDVHHDEREAIGIFAREIAPAGLAMGPGRCSLVGGRPAVTPLIRLFSFLLPKVEVPVNVISATGMDVAVEIATNPSGTPGDSCSKDQESSVVPAVPIAGRVPLVSLAIARSGDKGDTANIGVIARKPEFLPWIRAELTPERVAEYFRHLVDGPVERFELPGVWALNFLMHGALDGGGTASLRNDPLGKCFAQILLDHPISVPEEILNSVSEHNGPGSIR